MSNEELRLRLDGAKAKLGEVQAALEVNDRMRAWEVWYEYEAVVLPCKREILERMAKG